MMMEKRLNSNCFHGENKINLLNSIKFTKYCYIYMYLLNCPTHLKQSKTFVINISLEFVQRFGYSYVYI